MTAWPNGLQWLAVSTTTSPVTQTADVAVNSATTRSASVPRAREIGNSRRIVPIVMRAAKPSTSTAAGVIGRRRNGRAAPTR